MKRLVLPRKNLDQSMKWSDAKPVVSDNPVLGEDTRRRKLGFHLRFPRGSTGLDQGQTASITVHSPPLEAGLSQLQFSYKIL